MRIERSRNGQEIALVSGTLYDLIEQKAQIKCVSTHKYLAHVFTECCR